MKSSSRFKHILILSAVTALVCLWTGELQAAVGAPAAEEGFRWVPFLAPFHNVVLHLPIGFVMLSCLIEAVQFRRPSEDGRSLLGLIHVCSALAMVLTVALGLARGADGGYEENTLSNHKNFGIAAGVLTLLVLGVHFAAFRKDAAKPPLQLLYRIFLFANLGVMSVAGHYGGNLTHGSDYLVANAPEFVKKMLGEGGTDSSEPTGPNTDDGPGETDPRMAHFENHVWPALRDKCLGCHGKEKQKGGYTLTDKEIAFKGGDSELAAIVPGNPAKSLLVESIMLPPDDDYVMPPDGKEPMSSDEIIAVVEWIRDGAIWPDTLPQ